MRYKLRRYNIKLENINLEILTIIRLTLALLTTFLSFKLLSENINNVEFNIRLNVTIIIGCFAVLGVGVFEYFIQIKKKFKNPRFDSNNYFWVFNAAILLLLFLINL